MGNDIKHNNLKNFTFYNFNSFLFLSLIPLLFIFLFTPVISGPRRPYTITYENWSYFESFGLELLILILGVSFGIILSGILVKIVPSNSKLNHLWENSFLHCLLILFPAVIFLISEKSGHSLVYEDNVDLLIVFFIIFSIFYYLLIMIMREFNRCKYKRDDYGIVSHWANSILILFKKIPSVINLFLFLTIILDLPFNSGKFISNIGQLMRYFGQVSVYHHSMFISFSNAFLVIAFQILILNIILLLAYSLITMIEKSDLQIDNKLSVYTGNEDPKVKFVVISLLSIIIFTLSRIFPVNTVQKILFFWSPFYANSIEVNTKPSLVHWFGTDVAGKDIFSMILFSFAEMVVIIIIILLILLILSFIFKSFIQSSKEIYTDNFYKVLANFPSLPILIVIAGYVHASSFKGNVLLIFLIYVIFFWSRYIKRVEYTENARNYIKLIIRDFRTIIPKLIIDITLIGFLGLLPSNSLNLGLMLRSFISGEAHTYWWNWFFPLLSLYIVISLLGKEKRFEKSP